MSEDEKPIAKVRTTKKRPIQPWNYAQQMSFVDQAKKFIRAQQRGDREAMKELAYRLEEDIKLGQSK